MVAHSRKCTQFCAPNSWAAVRPRPAAREKTLGAAQARLVFRAFRATSSGFSLLELLVTMVVMSVIMGGIVSAISSTEQTYTRTELKSDMYENVRGVAALMEQEIGQAGTLSSQTSKLGTAVSATHSPQAAANSSTLPLFVGEQVLVDAGSSAEEMVTITAVTPSAITATFKYSHPSPGGPTVTTLGVFPGGIVPPGTTNGSTSVSGPSVSVMNLFGDVNADGSLVYVRYTCDTSVTPGTLSRSVTTIVPGVNTIGTAQVMLSTLIPNPASANYPSGTPCFIFTTGSYGASSALLVTNVGVTLSVRSLKPDPQTGQYMTMTKSFLDLSPRNLLAAFELSNAGLTNRLQATPPNVLVY